MTTIREDDDVRVKEDMTTMGEEDDVQDKEDMTTMGEDDDVQDKAMMTTMGEEEDDLQDKEGMRRMGEDNGVQDKEGTTTMGEDDDVQDKDMMTTIGEDIDVHNKDTTTMGEEEDVQDAVAAGSKGNSDMDMEMIQWLDSVHRLLCLQDSLSQVLRRAWMEMAQAQYAMGPARISQPLYSLKPYAASASVSVKRSSPSSGTPETAVDQEDVFGSTNTCALHFALQKRSADGDDDRAPNQPSKNSTLKSGNLHGSSKSGQQVHCVVPSGWSREEDIAYKKLMGDTDDSDTDMELQSMNSTQAIGSTKPLQWFGGLVSPHLRAAQSSFGSALEILVDIANAQSNAVQGHGHGT